MDGPVGPLTFHVAVEGAAATLEVRHFGARPTAKVELGLIHVRSSRLRSLRRLKIHSHKIDIAIAIHTAVVVVVHPIVDVLVIVGIVARLLLTVATTLVHLVVHVGRTSLLLIVVVIVVVAVATATATNVGFVLYEPFRFYGRVHALEDR